MLRVGTLLLLCLAVATAGCLSDTAIDDETPTDATPAASQTADSTSTPTESAERSEATEPTVYTLDATFLAEAVNSGLDPADRHLHVPVPTDAQGLVAELRWDGTGDLDLAVWPQNSCGDDGNASVVDHVCRLAFFAAGEQEHAYGTDRSELAVQERALEVRVNASTIQAEDCGSKTCAWTGHVNPNLAVDTAFQLRISVFEQQVPSESYSAFGSS